MEDRPGSPTESVNIIRIFLIPAERGGIQPEFKERRHEDKRRKKNGKRHEYQHVQDEKKGDCPCDSTGRK